MGACFFVKKVESEGVFLYKKRTFPQRRVHCVHYQYFLFYILLIWGGALGADAPPPLLTGLRYDTICCYNVQSKGY